MRRDDEDEKYKPFKMGKLTSDFLFDEDGRQRPIKQHHRKGKGTGFFKKLITTGLLVTALSLIPSNLFNDQMQVFNDGIFDIPPSGQSSLSLPLNDPLFTRQWHLQNTGQEGGTPGIDINIVPAWKNYTGQGNTISVFELYDAMVKHPELDGHTSLISGTDKPEDDVEKYHATNVSSIAAGRANNHFGGVGVAPNANIISYGGTSVKNFRAQKGHDVVNASWMYINFFSNNQLGSNGRDAAWYTALQTSISEGRDRRGTIWLVAAGNDFLRGHNTNYSGLANNRFVNVIGAIDKNGHILNASSPGANVIASAPGHDLVMSVAAIEDSNIPESGSRKGSGTSYATPQASGVECLVLEANPYLGYRDARMILALSARQTDKGHATWMFNHASNWNGGRMHVSERFGYGLIDAHAMTRLAETWSAVSTMENEANIGKADRQGFDIPDGGSITRWIDLSDKNPIEMTDAQLRIRIKHPRMGDLLVELVSPSGTVSTLIKMPEHGKFTGHTDDEGKFTAFDEMDYVLGSVQFMGEKANGKWQIRITDTKEGETGHLDLLDLQLYGNEHSNDSRYFFTNEYADLGGEFLRARLTDTDGGRDQINASPVVSDSKISLEGGESEIAGRKINITPNVIEDVITGDGNDRITGSTHDNSFLPGRGDDVTDARGGENQYFYRDGDGDDTYTPSPTGKDRVYLLNGITPENTMLSREGNGLMVKFKEKPGSIFMGDYFTPGTGHKISTIFYPDGTFLRLNGDVRSKIDQTPKSVQEIGTQFGKVPTQPITPQPKPQSLAQRILKIFS